MKNPSKPNLSKQWKFFWPALGYMAVQDIAQQQTKSSV
jgi:hypothetical protein